MNGRQKLSCHSWGGQQHGSSPWSQARGELVDRQTWQVVRSEFGDWTAVSHRRDLMRKLQLHNAADVTRFAIRHGLVRGE